MRAHLLAVWFPALAEAALFLGDGRSTFSATARECAVLYLLIVVTWVFFGWLGAGTPALLAQQSDDAVIQGHSLQSICRTSDPDLDTTGVRAQALSHR